MAYVGLNPQTQLLNTSTETFSGNSVAYQFNLSRAVASASDLDVMIGTTLQRPNTDYEAENTVLMFQSPPATGTNNITVTYRAGALNSLNLTANAFGAGTVGTPSVYSVAANNTGIYWGNATTMNVTVGGTDRVSFTNAADATDETTGTLVVSGGIGASGNAHIGGIIELHGNTISTGVSTGALLVTSGGAGIAGNLNVGQNITCVGDFTVNGTFTTTGTDSLDVTDPFIFLANANPGDTYDSGIITEYDDGVTRYAGIFRDITDDKWKLFGNLTNKPSTTVDTANASFEYNTLIVSDLSATGNVNGTYFLGNGACLTGIITSVSNVTNGTSGLFVPALNGNVIVNVGGATIATVSSSVGLAITGNVNASTGISAAGNIVGGNITTAGIASATGNITSAGNVSGGNVLTGGLISAAGGLTAASITTGGAVTATGNVTGGNINTAGLVTATGNVTGGNLKTGGIVQATGGIYGDLVSVNNGVSAGTVVAAGTDVTAGGDISASGAVNAGTTISAIGNITGDYFLGNGRLLSGIDATSIQNGTSNVRVVGSGANVAIGIGGTSNVVVIASTGQFTTGLASVTGNVIGGNIVTSGQVTATGNLSGGNVNGGANVNATLILGTTVSATGNVNGGNINTAGLVTATGNITGGNIITGGAVSATGIISATANVTGGNLITTGLVSVGGTVSATGNVTGGNINTAGLVSATGNLTNGIANVLTGNAIVTTLVQAATLSATGNVIGGNLNAAGLSLSGNVVSGLSMITNITTTANITGGNVLSSGAISTTGAVTGGSITTAGNISIPTAAADTNTTQAASTAFVIGQASAVTPTAIASAGAQGTSLRYARADHTHSGVTSVSAGTAISVSATSGALTVNNTGVTALTGGGGITVSAGTGSITLGSTATSVNTPQTIVARDASGNFAANVITATATTARYADLAENYAADAGYEPGTVLVFGGNNEVTISTADADVRVAGVVSTDPAHLMNSCLDAEYPVALALTGRVPTQVVGKVRKGDMMVSAPNGRAQACATPAMGTVIGKALQDFDGEAGTIEIVVGRL